MEECPILPHDILLLIAEYVTKAHPSSLREFALVSKSWASAAFVQLHRSISFTIVGRTRLQQDVDSCRQMLARSASFKYVRRLEIGGPGPYSDASNVEHPHSGWRLAPDEDLGESCFEITGGRHFVLKSRAGRIEKWEECPERAWSPIVGLVEDLPGLKDLLWNCPQKVPENLRLTIELTQPNVRLWMNTFGMASLDRSALTGSEWRLINSPSLYALRAAYMKGDLEEAAIARVTSRMIPNLNKLSLHSAYPAASWDTLGEEFWRDFKSDHPMAASRRRTLSSLSLVNTRGSNIIEPVCDHTSLDTLKHLAISCSPLGDLWEAVARHDFENLVSLELEIRDVESRREPWLDNARDFLLALPPLSALELTRRIHFLAIQKILNHHGHALRRLWLFQVPERSEQPNGPNERNFDTPGLIESLPRSCPLLEELAIPMRRSKGDRSEVDAYRSLRALLKLRVLDLKLDCSDYAVLWSWEDPYYVSDDLYLLDWPEPPFDPAYNDFDLQYYPESFIDGGPQVCGPPVRNGHISDALINSAVDENLARAIFTCISGDRHQLEKLTIRTRGGAVFTPYSSLPMLVNRVFREVSRDWVLKRSVRDDRRNEVSANDVTKPFRTKKWQGRACDLDKEIELEGVMEQIFRKLWPERDHHIGDWTKQWHSFPLKI